MLLAFKPQLQIEPLPPGGDVMPMGHRQAVIYAMNGNYYRI